MVHINDLTCSVSKKHAPTRRGQGDAPLEDGTNVDSVNRVVRLIAATKRSVSTAPPCSRYREALWS